MEATRAARRTDDGSYVYQESFIRNGRSRTYTLGPNRASVLAIPIAAIVQLRVLGGDFYCNGCRWLFGEVIEVRQEMVSPSRLHIITHTYRSILIERLTVLVLKDAP